MRFIEAGRAEVVLIFKFERVFRSTEDWTPLRAFPQKHHRRLESPVEDLADVTPMQRFHNNMRANLAEYERDNNSEKAVSRSSGSPSVRMQDRDKHVHLLKGLIFCGCCKRAMIPNFGGQAGQRRPTVSLLHLRGAAPRRHRRRLPHPARAGRNP